MDVRGDTAGRVAPGERAAASVLAVLIFLGSIFLWLGIPALWIWVLAQLSSDYPSVFVLAILGCPTTMALWGLVLVRLNGLYLRATHGDAVRERTAWLGSLSGERTRRRSRTLLDTSMTVSVVLAITAILVWFFFFAAYQSLPDLTG
ncbi:MAG: hypothetical protein H0V29_07815 [Thermoleophilaceae bacterium]|nr:hypothetical protein [Thermoleophilaceae bacterium]